MTFDLFGGRRLLLAGSRLGGFWVAAGVLALVLLVVLYREERRLVSRRAGLGLLGLRLAAAAVLVLALFEPIAAQTFHTVVKGRVFVALDVSESMATAARTLRGIHTLGASGPSRMDRYCASDGRWRNMPANERS